MPSVESIYEDGDPTSADLYRPIVENLIAEAKAKGCTCVVIGAGVWRDEEDDETSIVLEHGDLDCPLNTSIEAKARWN